MVCVRLARGWIDDGGAAHTTGDMVDVDAVTLAELEADGVVATAERVSDVVVHPTHRPDPTGPSPRSDG
jgi:hypothetical protein